MNYPSDEEMKAVAKQDGNPIFLVKNQVYDASQLVPSIVSFTRRQYLFLNHYRLGVPLEEAARKSEMTAEEAERFLDRPKTKAWLEDRATKDHIRNEWAEGGKWWQMGDECLEGKRHLSKDQQVVFMAFGERVCPKTRDPSTEIKTTINVNFTAEDVKEAFRRQATIDAEISK